MRTAVTPTNNINNAQKELNAKYRKLSLPNKLRMMSLAIRLVVSERMAGKTVTIADAPITKPPVILGE